MDNEHREMNRMIETFDPECYTRDTIKVPVAEHWDRLMGPVEAQLGHPDTAERANEELGEILQAVPRLEVYWENDPMREETGT